MWDTSNLSQYLVLPGDDTARQSHSTVAGRQSQESSALPLTKLSFDLSGPARFAHSSKMPGRLSLLTETSGEAGAAFLADFLGMPSQGQPGQGRWEWAGLGQERSTGSGGFGV